MYNLSIPYLFNLLETATERERKIIILRFKEGLTLEQAGNEFGLSGRKIAEIENRALGKLRRKCRMGLRIFIDIDQLNDWEQLEEKAIIWGIGYKGFKFENGILKGELWKRLGLFQWKTPVEDIIRAKKEEVLSHNDEYALPVRTYNFLKKRRFNGIKDLMYASVDDIIRLRREGRNTFDELLEVMAPHITRPMDKVMDRFDKADKYRNKKYKHYFVTQKKKKDVLDAMHIESEKTGEKITAIEADVTRDESECFKQTQRYKSISIDEIELSCIPYNYLKKAGINTVADLISLTKDEIMSLQGIGIVSLEEIIEETEKAGVPSEALIHLWQAALEKAPDKSRYEILPEGILIRNNYYGEPDRMVRMNTRLLLENQD